MTISVKKVAKTSPSSATQYPDQLALSVRFFQLFAKPGAANLAFLTAWIRSPRLYERPPNPALDGGRWLIIAIYKLRRKNSTKETEEKSFLAPS